jgi:ABC-type glutathione transport system ATPase component
VPCLLSDHGGLTLADILRVTDLVVHYPSRATGNAFGRDWIRAVKGVSLSLQSGTTMALVGESGSGKSSIAKAILGVGPTTSGAVELAGRVISKDIKQRPKPVRRQLQMVFQQPTSSLDPRVTIGRSIGEPMIHLLGLRGRTLKQRVIELLEMVDLDESFSRRLPRELSGGQCQRAAIARAISTSPAVIIADEPTSSLDVSVQAQIVNLLVRLQQEFGIAYMFISHDLAVVRQVADTIAVLNQGTIVETGDTQTVLDSPTHSYTRSLIEAVPSIDVSSRAKPFSTIVENAPTTGDLDASYSNVTSEL